MKKVDIILPVYNGEKFLKEQIDSLLNQTYKNINIYIRDDHSSDKSFDIVSKLADQDSRIIIISDEKGNLGLVKNIDRILYHSTADYIMYCDQDDVWFSNKVEVLMKEILKAEDEYSVTTPILVHSDSLVTDENLKERNLFLGKKPRKTGVRNSLFMYYVQGASSLFNRALKLQIHPFIENVYLHDRYTHLVAEMFGKRIYINEPLMNYRQHSYNLVGSSGFWKKIRNNLYSKNLNFFIEQDKLLIEELFKTKFKNSAIILTYLKITSKETSKIKKIELIIKNKISMRSKDFIVLLLKK